MKWNQLLVRYGELTLKGRNRKEFIRQLKKNVKFRLKGLDDVQVEANHDRMIIRSPHTENIDEIIERLPNVFGIHSYSPIAVCEPTLEAIQEKALEVMNTLDYEGKTFKVEVKRADKTFPHTSQEMRQILGAHILRNTEGLTVQMKKPEITLHVDIRRGEGQISAIRYEGAGGLPVGANGKSLLLLSGGIDSPVAGYLMMKRGVSIEAIHFASPPFTSDMAKEKVIDLAEELSAFGPTVKVHVIPFTKIQQTIDAEIPSGLTMTTTRRLMMMIADRLREEIGALGIVTGESLGQVASQTLESMTAINAVTSTPIIRPLVTYDKSEIIELSQHIGTYETSIRPYEDCCTVFTPANPKTKPRVEEVERFEEKVDFEPMIEEALRTREIIVSTNREGDYDHLL